MNPPTQVNAMPSSAPRQTCPRRRPATRVPTACVVDPRPEDYAAWQATAEERGLRLTFFANADEALRFARSETVDLWVVNTDLAGLSGYELCGMLKNQSARATVYLVANDYSSEAEQSAWQARATLFGCKPGHVPWLDQWLAIRRQDAPRPPITAPRGVPISEPMFVRQKNVGQKNRGRPASSAGG